MKSTLIIMLLVLASYYNSGALACEAIDKFKNIVLFKSNDELKKELSKYTSDIDALNAAVKAKGCMNSITILEKGALLAAVVKGWKDC